MAVTIRGSGQVPVQVVSTTLNTVFTTASTSFTDLTGLSATITPTNSANKIMIIVNTYYSSNSGSGITVFNLVRGSTNICQPSNTGLSFSGTASGFISVADNICPVSISFLDSPATTSATTYKVQLKTNTGTSSINQRNSADGAFTSTITLMEIAYA